MIKMKFDLLSFQPVTKKKFWEENVSYRLFPPPTPHTPQKNQQQQQQKHIHQLKAKEIRFHSYVLVGVLFVYCLKKVCLLLLLITFVYRYSPLSSRFTVLVSHLLLKEWL